jgi:hypothetical protein
VLQYFVGDPELLECVNPAGGEGKVDRPSADEVAGARIGASLVKVDLVPAFPQIRSEQTARETAANEGNFCAHSIEWLTADQTDITNISNRCSRFALPATP